MVAAVPLEDENVQGHLSRLKDGCILLSHENLQDPNFTLTVVLICIFNQDGAFGLVCNRPSHMPLSEVFNVDTIYKTQRRNIYIGGPVQQETLHIIQITDKAAKQAYTIAPRVYLGGEWESLEAILSEDQASTRLFLGYSGWAAGQLEAEIAEGAWEVYTVDLEKFLTQWEEPMFTDITAIRTYLKKLSIS
jgi:putative transcriptional regulator